MGSACPLPGVPMARLSLLDTVTTLSVSGRCLLLAPGRSSATKKSPALPLLKKKHRRKLSWPCARSARCTVRSKLYVHIVLFALCAYAALPEFCGCNLNKLEGRKKKKKKKKKKSTCVDTTA